MGKLFSAVRKVGIDEEAVALTGIMSFSYPYSPLSAPATV